MNIQIKQVNKSKLKYPKIIYYKNNNAHILMTNETTGTVLNESNVSFYKPGYYSTSWDKENQIDFDGEITLSNEQP